MKKYMIIFVIELAFALLYTILKGFTLLHLINGLFIFGMLGLCIGLFMMMYGDGAYSIMGHSFRKFNYIMAPKRIKQTMEEDPNFRKELHIRQEKYRWTNPILLTSIGVIGISIIAMFLGVR
ncbi:DUF3899 domain-containing protein [Macrococcoides caseolyticum]|uniref:DUF3899 domain-containing protein n=1 Tax=Macrococcoides caseolyticum TaxID=69966 RepID=UPI001F385779|nr:DUF3899 domain-containing protein [Macrococcus caseolyticus]MCE4955738.1 DUF3899 domain-containing protein [Macrococcus caseolyticus]